jgi:hypothetical protein
MQCLSPTLERVRRRTPGRSSRPATPQAPPPPPRHPFPSVLVTRLVDVRGHRRARHAAPPQVLQASPPQECTKWFPPLPWEDTGAMVRPCVAHLGEAPRTARAGAQTDPWGNAS